MTDTLMKRMFVYSWTWFYIDLLLFFIQINMLSSCLKLLLGLTLFVILTECRPKKLKECNDDADCGSGFSCQCDTSFIPCIEKRQCDISFISCIQKRCAKALAVKPSK